MPDRILTTHVGSLVRPPKLIEFWKAIEGGQPYDEAAFEACLSESVAEIVAQQAETGIDIVSDGEFSKGANWAFYVYKRLSGIGVRPITAEEAKDPMASQLGGQDRQAFPEFYAEYDVASGLGKRLGNRVVVNAPIRYSAQQVSRDIRNLKAGIAKVSERYPSLAGFLPVVAPASALPGAKNEHYKDEETFLFALADALHQEYQAVIDAGLYVQIDDAFLPYMHERMVPPMSNADYRRWAQMRIDALNHALRGIPEERSRYHICWGSWNGPHAFDVPLKDIIDLVVQVRVGHYSLFLRGRQCAPRTRMAGLGECEARTGQDPDSRRHQSRHQHRRASGACRRANRTARQDRRPRERHRRHRLRICAEPVRAPRPPHDHVGEAQSAGRRRPPRDADAVGQAGGGVSRRTTDSVRLLRAGEQACRLDLHAGPHGGGDRHPIDEMALGAARP